MNVMILLSRMRSESVWWRDDVDGRQTIEKRKERKKNGGQENGKKKNKTIEKEEKKKRKTVKETSQKRKLPTTSNTWFLYLAVTRKLLLVRDSTMAASTSVNTEISYFLLNQSNLRIRIRCNRNGIKSGIRKGNNQEI